LSFTYIVQGRAQDALPGIELVRYEAPRTFLYALAYHALGREKESDAALRQLVAKYHTQNAYLIAEVYAFRNQSDEAFKWLDRAYAQRDDTLIETKVDPFPEEPAQGPAICRVLEQAQLPELTYVALFQSGSTVSVCIYGFADRTSDESS
jgi:hypothetical protein